MKILGQLLIGLAGGIVAIFLYRTFEEDKSNDNKNNDKKQPVTREAHENNRSNSSPFEYDQWEVDSINNVFHVGFGEAADRILKEVVHIRSRMAVSRRLDPFEEYFGEDFWEQEFRQSPWSSQQIQEASGSGVIVSADGHIVTNYHVISNAQQILVSLYNGSNYTAEVVGTDPSTDLAVIRIDAEQLPVAQIGNSDSVRVGDWVLAVGNPFNLASTVTAGIVSAKARNIGILSDNSAIESFIQTDAAVNPGNSGGALVNLSGELIGINTAIATPSGTFAGYAFAVPSNIVRKVVSDILQYGVVQRGYLGVTVLDLNSQLAEEMGLDIAEGVVVAGVVDGGAADKAGLRQQDVILEIDGTKIVNTPQLQEIVARHRPGDVLELTLLRNKREREMQVKLQGADKAERVLDN